MSLTGPVVLTILDGWGIAPPSDGNAVTLAKTPNLDRWRQEWPHTELAASGTAVGLAPGQDGNSEAGHMNIGAGRVVLQDNMRILASIHDGTFFRNPAFFAAIQHVRKHNSTLHLMGMLGNSESAHANPDHLLALLMLVQNQNLSRVKLHLFTDGRDSPRYLAGEIIGKFLPHLGDAQIATVCGRWFAMDRNKNWMRTETAYRAITEGLADHHVKHMREAIAQAYNRGETDEFITPTVVDPYTGMDDGDAIIDFNLRSDRARQLAKTFVQPDFEIKNKLTRPFTRQRILRSLIFVAMTDFGPDLPNMLTAYPAVDLNETLPMVLHDRRQLYIAESEKYAHVTYFFNGGYADPVGDEQRIQVPSPDVKYYDGTPAMSSKVLVELVIQAVKQRQFDFIVMNFANTDMVAHTGNLAAGIQAMELTDGYLSQLEKAIVGVGGILVATGDHGNIEEMKNLKTGEIDTEHSANPVPFIVVGSAAGQIKLHRGSLCDVAPTLLRLMNRQIPPAMTGQSLY